MSDQETQEVVNIDEVEAKIRAAVKAHTDRGGTIRAGSFGEDTCRCPMGCVAVEFAGGASSEIGAAAAHLGVDTYWVWLFIEGFDRPRARPFSAATKLGSKLRAEFLP